MKDLLLQVLGESDTQIKGKPGSEKLKNCGSKDALEKQVVRYKNDIKNDVEFPIIEQFYKIYEGSNAPILGIILTDQSKWIEDSRANTGDAWKKIGSTDGIWWQDSITAWCKAENKNIECYPLHFKIRPGPHNGVADWEQMAQTLGNNFLRNHITFKDRDILFKPSEEATPIKIRRIIIQHSSGTPALSSALYLWGIEQKIAGIENIEFVYIAKDDKNTPPFHTGKHWQWKFKNAQVQELLKISDFNGALAILDSQHEKYKELKEGLEFLDRSVSFNLNYHSILDTKTSLIERISIAVWSEKAFRQRRHWMHWMIRVAGAFELAILWLVYMQGGDKYEWTEKIVEEKPILHYKNSNPLIQVNPISVNRVVTELLANGHFKDNDPPLTLAKIEDKKWLEFCNKFYTNGWRVTPKISLPFIGLRNGLYHQLMGDKVDKFLDEYKIDDDKHPAQVALKYLDYVIELAGLKQEVENKVQTYQQKVKKIEGWLV
ncbi:hypothetical protein NG799_01975 [Laspinema sp. D1]|uniref:Uncharacterized protein n=1 Tax=Laspinema palackyanum D2a TaxID=2953684 RepID=A0ABT2MM70_9CYAN|nr:hypothetical protein [Laspinema sp. D2a]